VVVQARSEMVVGKRAFLVRRLRVARRSTMARLRVVR
jgi:hypothetical protein